MEKDFNLESEAKKISALINGNYYTASVTSVEWGDIFKANKLIYYNRLTSFLIKEKILINDFGNGIKPNSGYYKKKINISMLPVHFSKFSNFINEIRISIRKNKRKEYIDSKDKSNHDNELVNVIDTNIDYYSIKECILKGVSDDTIKKIFKL